MLLVRVLHKEGQRKTSLRKFLSCTSYSNTQLVM